MTSPAQGTVFTDALLEVLGRRDLNLKQERLSLKEVCEGTRLEIYNHVPAELAVKPECFPVDQRDGDLSDIGLFPNPAYRRGPVRRLDAQTDDIENRKKEIFEDNPYLLGMTFAGREESLRDLTEWAKGDRRIFCICDLGGTGKTALVWHWFNRADTVQLLAEQGYSKFWATFYAKGYDSLKFLRHLAHRLNLQVKELDSIASDNAVDAQRSLQQAILRRLRAERWFLILDGLEREMGAFANPGNQYDDSEKQDLRNENGEILSGEKFIRSVLFGEFVRGLLETQAKVIITSRLFPEDLRGTDYPERVAEYPFRPLSPEDATKVWNLVAASDTSDLQLQFFKKVDYHPQVIVIVASAVAESGTSTGFQEWFMESSEAEQAACLDDTAKKTTLRHRWIDLATRDIVVDKTRKKAWIVLCLIATQSEASNIEFLVASLVGPPPHLFPSRETFTDALRYLRKRRLLGFEEDRGQVDIHPVIRTHITRYILAQVEKNGADADQEVLQHLEESGSASEIYQRFMSQPKLEEALQALDSIERRSDQFRDKYFLFQILTRLYPNCDPQTRPWLDNLPELRYRKDQALWLLQTGSALMECGQWEESVVLFRRAQMAYRLCGDTESAEECARTQDWQRLYGGSLRESELRLLKDLEKGRDPLPESRYRYWLVLLLAIRQSPLAREALDKLRPDVDRWTLQSVAEAWYYLEDYDKAKDLAAAALERKERTLVGQWLWELVTLGLARLRLGDIAEATARLDEAGRGGLGHFYPIITMFAYAGHIEGLYLQAKDAGGKKPTEKQQKLTEATHIYGRYTKFDPRNQYQIPAAEAHLAAAKVQLERGNSDDAVHLAELSLQVARGEESPFCYAAGQKRAIAFLTSLGKPVPARSSLDPFSVRAHENRVRELVQTWEWQRDGK